MAGVNPGWTIQALLFPSQNLMHVDHDAVREETVKARRAFERRGWPVIDVTRRSVEETAAAIINLLSERRSRSLASSW